MPNRDLHIKGYKEEENVHQPVRKMSEHAL